MKLIATCTFGLEKLLKNELKSFSIQPTKTEDGRVYFEGDDAVLAKANIHLRTADRVLIEMGEAHAVNFDELFEAVYALPWEDVIRAEDAFPVVATSARSMLHSEPAIQSIVKKAIVKRLMLKHSTHSLPENSGVMVRVVVKANKDHFVFTLDSSGEALHKRGYRVQASEAPIKETLASALILLSGWGKTEAEDRVLIDPFCGSGTLCIEAAMIANRQAPGLKRAFAFETWPWISKASTEQVKKEAEAQVRQADVTIQASDINPRMTEIAQINAKNAGVGSIHFKTADLRQLNWSNDAQGVIVTNPPYGQRLEAMDQARELYRTLGERWKASPHDLVLITSFEPLEASMGQKASKNRKLYNGGLQCYCYEFRKTNG